MNTRFANVMSEWLVYKSKWLVFEMNQRGLEGIRSARQVNSSPKEFIAENTDERLRILMITMMVNFNHI